MVFARKLVKTRLAALLLVVGLLLGQLVPAGFMPASGARSLAVTLCDGGAGRQERIILAGKSAPGQKAPGGQAECSFAAIGPALGATDAPLALAKMPSGVAMRLPEPRAPRIDASAHLRPPLRGPPLLA